MRLGARWVRRGVSSRSFLCRWSSVLVPLLIVGLILGQGAVAPPAGAAELPVVSGLSPAGGQLSGGTVVTVTGTGFTDASRVDFGGADGTALTVLSDTQIQVTSPSRSAAGEVAVRVSTPGGTSASSAEATFTYQAAATISGLSPASGPVAGGTVVTISGSDFAGVTGVTFGSVQGTNLQVLSPTQLKITSPAGAVAGSVNVQITATTGVSPITTTSVFTYLPMPVVAAVAPSTGPLSGGTLVTVKGTGLSGASRVTFGGTNGTALAVVSDTELRVTSPARSSTGSVSVRVTTPGGVSAVTTVARFSYAATPAVVAVSPGTGPVAGGTVITLTGTDLTGATEVTFGTQRATAFQPLSGTQVRATSPAAAGPGQVDVRVTTPGGQSPTVSAGSFTYVAVPVVSGVMPAAGPLGGGTVVSVFGTGLSGASGITFGGTPAAGFAVVSDTELLVTTAPHAAAADVAVQVTTSGGTSAPAAGVTFSFRDVPAVAAVTPASGPLAGGTTVTIAGTGFTGASQVTFGGQPGSGLAVQSDTQLTVNVPAGASAAGVEVRVTAPGGTSPATSGATYTYQPATAQPVEYCGTLPSNQTWDATSVRVITCPLSVPAGVTLTLAPGAVVKLTGYASIGVEGSLLAQGTSTAPVTLTSHKDDSVGGDTNGGGSTVKPAARNWGGIYASSGSTLDLAHTTVRYGSGISAGDAAKFSVVNCELRDGVPLAVNRSGGAIGPITITGTTVAAVGSGAGSGITVDVRNDRAGIAPTVTKNVVSGVTRYAGDIEGGRAITVSGPQLLPSRLSGNTGSGNAQNALFVSGTLAQNVTLPGAGLRWVVDRKWGSGLTVLPGITLTLKAGAVLKVAPRAHIDVLGALVASGTATSGVSITSLKDDGVGGDTNGGGVSSIPAAGDWYGITVGGGATLGLTRTTVSYGSGISAYDAASVSVVDSRMRYGVPLAVSRSGSATGPITITGNTLSAVGPGSRSGIYVDSRNDRDGIAPTVSGNTVSGVLRYEGDVEGGRAITVTGYRLLPSLLAGNTGSGNAQDALFIAGSLAQSATAPTTGLPWVVDNAWPWSFSVLPGVTLTLEAGTELKVAHRAYLNVLGTLVAAGTAEAPVTITSLKDDIGGDLNGDGEGEPAIGDWGGISVNYGATLDLLRTTVRFGSGIWASDAAKVSVVDSELRDGVPLSVSRSASYSGPITITGTTVADVGPTGGSAISVDVRNDQDGLAPTVTGNHVSGVVRYEGSVDGGRAITVSGPRLLPSLLSGNTGEDNAQNALFLSGSIAESATVPTSGLPWVVDRSWTWSLTVRPGVVLTVPSGGVLKVDRSASINVEGGLVGAGTATAAASITGLQDDSVGGDTNGDGTDTSATAGSWSGIGVGTGATLDLLETVVRYGSGISAGDAAKVSVVSSELRNGTTINVYRSSAATGPVTISGNTVADVGTTSGSGINVDVHNDRDGIAPTVKDNIVTGTSRYDGDVSGGRAVTVSGLRLLPARLTGNSGSGNAQNALFVSGSLAGNVTLPGTGLRWVVDRSWSWGLTIRPGVTVTLKAGMALKVEPRASINVEGALVSSGTAAAPATITSLRDDTVGGDTDGASGVSPAAGDWSGLNASTGATLNLTRTTVRYGTGVQASDAAAVSVIDSQLRNGVPLVVYRSYSATGSVTITGNTVADVGYGYSGIAVDVRNDSDGIAPTVANNSVGGVQRWGEGDLYSGRAITVSGPRLQPSKLAGNSASGNAQNALFIAGSITESATLSPVGLPWVVDRAWPYALTVGVGTTLTLNAGSALKVAAGGSVYVDGSLVAAGTAASPATITSLLDDSVGGDLDGGVPTPPSASSWQGIVVNPGGQAQLDGTTLRFADTALSVANGAQANVHGRIIDVRVGVVSETFVDATNVFWGDDSGPTPTGSGASVEGAGVMFVPWVGYVAPPRPAVAPPLPEVPDDGCRAYMFVGARGSSESPQGAYPDYGFTGPADGFGSDVWDAYYGFSERLKATDPGATVKPIGLRYKAMGVFYNPFKSNYFNSVYEGVDNLIDLLYRERKNCPGQKVVLGGYSQGALAIHIALRQLAAVDSFMVSDAFLAGVILVADPAKTSRGAELVWSGADSEANFLIKGGAGVWASTFGLDPELGGPLPAAVTGKTVSICHWLDVVCGVGPLANPIPHLQYEPAETNAMGRWVADRLS